MKIRTPVRSPRSEVRSRRASAAGVPTPAPGSLRLTLVPQEMEVQPEMLLKTKRREHGTREYGTRGAPILASALPGTLDRGEQGAHTPVTGYPGNILKIKVLQYPCNPHQWSFANALALGSLLLIPASQEMKVQPEMLLKTNGRVRSPRRGPKPSPCDPMPSSGDGSGGGPRSEVTSRKASAAGAPILTPGSLLLTPALQEMKVHPAILMKTQERRKSQITKKVNKCEVRSPASTRY